MNGDYIDEYVVMQDAESCAHDTEHLSEFLKLVAEIAKGQCIRECPACGGRGDVWSGGESKTCEVCGGSGKVAWVITCRPYDPNGPVPEVDLDDIPF